MPKNAYEIRLDVLNMAHGDSMMKFQEKINFYRTVDEKGNLIQPSEEIVDKLFPKSHDIIARAEELYKFVENQ